MKLSSTPLVKYEGGSISDFLNEIQVFREINVLFHNVIYEYFEFQTLRLVSPVATFRFSDVLKMGVCLIDEFIVVVKSPLRQAISSKLKGSNPENMAVDGSICSPSH